jgi:lysophospholipase L1-like esterase
MFVTHRSLPSMSRTGFLLLAFLGTVNGLSAGPVLDNMDEIRFRSPEGKGKAELVEGKVGKAVRFSFDKDSRGAFFTSKFRGSAEWDRAAGFSFWVKGDGSDSFAGLELIYDDDYALRYDYCFPIKGTEWTKVTVAWRDLVPVLPGPKSKPLGPGGNNPSKVSALALGKWWYWRDYPAHSFAVDEIRLEEKIELDDTDYRPSGAPLERVLAKLKAGKPVTIVTVGDSLTDFNHWANRKNAWPTLLTERLREKYKSEVTLINPAIGGTQLRQNLVLFPRWLAQAPQPDLVLFCFGYNDWDAGMRGLQFQETYEDAVDRVRRATKGSADVLLLTTIPALKRWTDMAELAEACRVAAKTRKAGLADTEKAFQTAGKENREKLYATDQTHLGAAGHEVMAATVFQAIEKAGK